jgi:tetratricopeptide (TPR) repeat protein
MKYFLILSLLFVSNLHAQNHLQFDKRFVQSEDRWVAFQKDKDSSHSYGFIYIDEQAGLTFNYEGTFKITPTGEFVPKKLDSTHMKVRLQPNNVLVAFIPETKFKELQIPAIPEWLKHYKTDTNSVARLYRWGFMYNGWQECEKALTFLEKAKAIDINYKGLAVELAYSYNCLGKYADGILVLQLALKDNPTDAYANKELIYALIQSGQLDKAARSCKNAIAICTDKTYNGENSYNLLHAYYQKKDKDNFNLWLAETNKWNAGNDKLLRSIETMKSEINK